MLSGYRTCIRLGTATPSCWVIGVRNAHIPACTCVTSTENDPYQEQQPPYGSAHNQRQGHGILFAQIIKTYRCHWLELHNAKVISDMELRSQAVRDGLCGSKLSSLMSRGMRSSRRTKVPTGSGSADSTARTVARPCGTFPVGTPPPPTDAPRAARRWRHAPSAGSPR